MDQLKKNIKDLTACVATRVVTFEICKQFAMTGQGADGDIKGTESGNIREEPPHEQVITVT